MSQATLSRKRLAEKNFVAELKQCEQPEAVPCGGLLPDQNLELEVRTHFPLLAAKYCDRQAEDSCKNSLNNQKECGGPQLVFEVVSSGTNFITSNVWTMCTTLTQIGRDSFSSRYPSSKLKQIVDRDLNMSPRLELEN